MLRIDIVSMFPSMFHCLHESIVGRAVGQGLLQINVHGLRDFASDRHRTVDDEPYGGGPGMVLMAAPLVAAAKHCVGDAEAARVILLTPRGKLYNATLALELAREAHIVLLCGHYKGVDERVSQLVVTDEISIGDYVLTGGEIPAMAIVDSVARLLPGAVSDVESVRSDSFCSGGLDHPQYTRPKVFMGLKVPDVLLSGNHQAIGRWRRAQALRATLERRPDLLRGMEFSDEDKLLVGELMQEDEGDGRSDDSGSSPT